jgi:hypothetical protein
VEAEKSQIASVRRVLTEPDEFSIVKLQITMSIVIGMSDPMGWK